jgi:zinc D-Ala-D-Ala carboxypeptidase
MKKLFVFICIVVVAIIYFKGNEIPSIQRSTFIQSKITATGDLQLINEQYPIQATPNNLAVIPAQLSSNVLINEKFYLEEHTIEPLQQMFEAAAQDGVQHFIINSAYRSSENQQLLYEKHGAEHALPGGYSEHESGLALDIGSTQGTMDNTPEGEWLAKNAHKFGFILRYPADKVHITGIRYEPWHFRYVGLPHSELIFQKNLALEEYLQSIEVNGK